jgi:hypothetical protein
MAAISRDHGDSALRAPLPPSSQIGVDFNDLPSIGAGFSGVSWVWFFRYLPVANCYLPVVKDRSTYHFLALERISRFTILFAFLSSKNPLHRYDFPASLR